jgi:hypothetical protein
MAGVVVTVRDGKANSRDLDLPADVPIRSLAPWLARAIEHTDLAKQGEDVKYILKLEGSKEPLDPDGVLGTAGVVHGDVLQLLIRRLPKELTLTEAGRLFAGPGLVSAQGRVFPFRPLNALVGRVDRSSGVAESLLAVDLTDLDTGGSPSVSRRHAQILFRAGQYLVHDLKSVNGTRVNGRAVKPDDRVELSDGDQIQFGDVKLIFVWDGQEIGKPTD